MSHFPSDAYRRGAANRDPEDEALGWVVHLNSGDVSETDQREFTAWQAEPENALAFERAERLWIGLGPILEQQEAAGWPFTVATPARARRERFPHMARFAACAAALLVAVTSVEYVRVWQYDHVSGNEVGRSMDLLDGSRVVMGPATAFTTEFNDGFRHVSLARGEAYFDVRHDPVHPFIISVGNGMVRVLGTAFSVRKFTSDDVVVTVARGGVEVTSGTRRVVLTPDREIRFGKDGLGRIRAVDASLAMAWMRGRLIMEDKPLAEVLAELDRYRDGKILLLNDEAGQRRINAVIDLGRTDSWLTALASSQGLKLNSAGPVTVLR